VGRRRIRLEYYSPLLIALAVTFVDACDTGEQVTPTFVAGGAGGFGAGSAGSPSKGGCASFADEDGDGIPDRIEGQLDSDGDGLPNLADRDSDNDGVSDRDETFGVSVCELRDCDGDGAPDIQDPDSDNDLVPDADERAVGFFPCIKDSDNDGCDDLAELVLGGCDASHVKGTICGEDPERVQPIVRFQALDAAERLDLHVEVIKLENQFDPAWIEGVEPVDVSPSQAASIDSGGFSNVVNGATLGATVKFSFPPALSISDPWALLAVRAYTPGGVLLGEGLLIAVVGHCDRPIPI